jgi:hypothetical protein
MYWVQKSLSPLGDGLRTLAAEYNACTEIIDLKNVLSLFHIVCLSVQFLCVCFVCFVRFVFRKCGFTQRLGRKITPPILTPFTRCCIEYKNQKSTPQQNKTKQNKCHR